MLLSRGLSQDAKLHLIGHEMIHVSFHSFHSLFHTIHFIKIGLFIDIKVVDNRVKGIQCTRMSCTVPTLSPNLFWRVTLNWKKFMLLESIDSILSHWLWFDSHIISSASQKGTLAKISLSVRIAWLTTKVDGTRRIGGCCLLLSVIHVHMVMVLEPVMMGWRVSARLFLIVVVASYHFHLLLRNIFIIHHAPILYRTLMSRLKFPMFLNPWICNTTLSLVLHLHTLSLPLQ